MKNGKKNTEALSGNVFVTIKYFPNKTGTHDLRAAEFAENLRQQPELTEAHISVRKLEHNGKVYYFITAWLQKGAPETSSETGA